MTDPHSIAPPWVAFPDLLPIRSSETARARGIPFTYHTIDWLEIWEPMSPEERQIYLKKWPTSALKFPPPWVHLPDLSPFQSWNQGYQEVFMKDAWFPYWDTLSTEEQALYLDFWDASADWRWRIATCCTHDDEEDDDDTADARWVMTVTPIFNRHRRPISFLPEPSGWKVWVEAIRELLNRPQEPPPPWRPRITFPPPWYFMPDLHPDATIASSVARRYIADYWRPDWLAYSDDFRARSLEEWAITPHWQDAIARWTDPTTFNAKADAKSSADFSAAFDKTLQAARTHTRKNGPLGPQNPFGLSHGGPDAALRAAGFDPETPFGQELRDYINYCWPAFWRSATLKEREDYLRKWAEPNDAAHP